MESININERQLSFPSRPSLNATVRARQRPINLISNFMRISIKPNDNFVSQYAIKIEPNVPSDSLLLRKMIQSTIKRELDVTYYPFIISGDSLFSPRQVEEIQVYNIKIKFQETDYEYQINIEKTNNDIILENIRSINNNTQKVKSFIEIVFKSILNANNGMVRFNKRSIFDFNRSFQLQECENAFIMPGYSTNVMITESGIFLRVGIKNKFINSKTCLEKIRELNNQYRNGEYKRKVTEFFENYSVMTVYGNHKVYKIEAISFDSNITNKTIIYRDRHGISTEITLQKYYRDQYQREIRNLDQPLLISYVKNSRGEKDPIYLVPELCYLTGMDEDMRSMESLKKSMTSRTKVSPKDRMDRINQFKSMIYNRDQNNRVRINRTTGEERPVPCPDDVRQQWGVNVGDFKQFSGRELDQPEIRFNGNIAQIKGGRFRPGELINHFNLDANSWTIICSYHNRQAADGLTNSFKSASRQMGVAVEDPRVREIRARNPNEWIEELKSMDFNHGLKIVLVILDRSTKSFYSSIKRFLYGEIGIPVQVVLKENCSKNLSYFSNVLNQMIVKMGGILYKIHLHPALSSKVKFLIN